MMNHLLDVLLNFEDIVRSSILLTISLAGIISAIALGISALFLRTIPMFFALPVCLILMGGGSFVYGTYIGNKSGEVECAKKIDTIRKSTESKLLQLSTDIADVSEKYREEQILRMQSQQETKEALDNSLNELFLLPEVQEVEKQTDEQKTSLGVKCINAYVPSRVVQDINRLLIGGSVTGGESRFTKKP